MVYRTAASAECKTRLFLRQYPPGGLNFLLLRRVYLRIGKIKLFERLHNRRRNYQVGEPFVVRRHHIPGSLFARGMTDHLFVSILIIVPVIALLNIRLGNFQCFSDSSNRARNLFLCSFLERCRKNFRITVPFRAMCRSKQRMSSKRSFQMSFVTREGGSSSFLSTAEWTRTTN